MGKAKSNREGSFKRESYGNKALANKREKKVDEIDGENGHLIIGQEEIRNKTW